MIRPILHVDYFYAADSTIEFVVIKSRTKER